MVVQGSCMRFSLSVGRWQSEVASLNIARKLASSCHLSGTIYVFGGKGADDKVLNSIESLRFHEVLAE